MPNDVIALLVALLGLGVVSAVLAFALYYFYSRNLDKHHAFVVKSDGHLQDGIPFYIRKGRIIHETSYLESLATYTLKATSILRDAEKKPVHSNVEYIHTKTVFLSKIIQDMLGEVAAAIADAQKAAATAEKVEHWNQAREKFEGLPAYDGSLPAAEMLLESNNVKLESYVDYAVPYYLNKRLPFSGTSEFAIELAADGTLSKSSVKQEDTTLSTVAGMIPIDTLFAKPKKETATDQTKTGEERTYKQGVVEATQDYEYTLTADYFHVRHIFFKISNDQGTLNFEAPIAPNATTTWYRREVVPSVVQKEDAGKSTKDDSDKSATT